MIHRQKIVNRIKQSQETKKAQHDTIITKLRQSTADTLEPSDEFAGNLWALLTGSEKAQNLGLSVLNFLQPSLTEKQKELIKKLYPYFLDKKTFEKREQKMRRDKTMLNTIYWVVFDAVTEKMPDWRPIYGSFIPELVLDEGIKDKFISMYRNQVESNQQKINHFMTTKNIKTKHSKVTQKSNLAHRLNQFKPEELKIISEYIETESSPTEIPSALIEKIGNHITSPDQTDFEIGLWVMGIPLKQELKENQIAFIKKMIPVFLSNNALTSRMNDIWSEENTIGQAYKIVFDTITQKDSNGKVLYGLYDPELQFDEETRDDLVRNYIHYLKGIWPLSSDDEYSVRNLAPQHKKNRTHLSINPNKEKANRAYFLGHINEYKKLEKLGAYGLQTFDSKLYSLQNLKELELSGYSLTKAPDLSQFKNLETLYISSAEFKEIPDELLSNAWITKLRIENCDYLNNQSLKKIEILDQLKDLGVTFCNVEDESTHTEKRKNEISWGSFHNLEKIDLYGNNLKTIPPSLQGCQNLQVMNLQGNPIHYWNHFKIPRSLKELRLDEWEFSSELNNSLDTLRNNRNCTIFII